MNIPGGVKVSIHRQGTGVGVSVEQVGPTSAISTIEQLWAFYDALVKHADERTGWMPKKEKKEDK